MRHSNELAFTFIMMLVFSRCTVLFNNYSTLYMAHSMPLACFLVIELYNYLNLNLSSQASFKQIKMHCNFIFCYL